MMLTAARMVPCSVLGLFCERKKHFALHACVLCLWGWTLLANLLPPLVGGILWAMALSLATTSCDETLDRLVYAVNYNMFGFPMSGHAT